MKKTLIYSCVFFNEKYIQLIKLLLKSYKLFGNSNDNIDYLIICNPEFKNKIQEIFDKLNINGKIWCLELKSKFEAGYSRLKIFDYPNINLYNKILYLDCDILITNSINNILGFHLENKLYVLQEGNTNHTFWGRELFDINPNCSAFTSGILLFNNNMIIKDLFSQILLHINNHINSNLPIPMCLDQPFIVYYAVKNNLYNNQKLIDLVINNPNTFDNWRGKDMPQNYNKQTICHFPGVPGHYESKIEKMSNFMNDIMFNIKNKEDIPEIIPHSFINKIKSKENQKNQKYIIQVGAHIGKTSNDFLINNIKDDIQYLLFEPVPYLFKQLCENYKNKKNVKLFNIAISNYNGSLPLYIPSEKNDFSKLVSYTSQLASTNENHIKTFVPNCIVDKIEVQCKTLNTIIEEYKIENLEEIYTDTEGHDYDILMDLDLTKHKPERIIFENKHMDGPKHQLIKSDCPKYNYLLNHFYKNDYEFVSETSENTIIKIKKCVNIYEDIWTCSDEFREHIKYFFKDKSHYKIAEIGSHKGYTTGYLSNIFEKVYAVDNSEEWTNFNKNLNKDKNNIEYVNLDIYKESWAAIPDVDVVFIDAGHSYQQCKSDMYNSIRNFKNLKYIIFDDYGVWSGVKQIVNESLINKTIIFEKYIGLNNVPGPNNKVVKNTSEGIICRINQLLNKKYAWENSKIEFLENGKMNAFGEGTYEFIDKYLVKCNFGSRDHLLKFNEDYSTFISIRKTDFEIVHGNQT